MDHSKCCLQLKSVLRDRNKTIAELQDKMETQAENIDNLELIVDRLQEANRNLRVALEIHEENEEKWRRMLDLKHKKERDRQRNQKNSNLSEANGCQENQKFEYPKNKEYRRGESKSNSQIGDEENGCSDEDETNVSDRWKEKSIDPIRTNPAQYHQEVTKTPVKLVQSPKDKCSTESSASNNKKKKVAEAIAKKKAYEEHYLQHYPAMPNTPLKIKLPTMESSPGSSAPMKQEVTHKEPGSNSTDSSAATMESKMDKETKSKKESKQDTPDASRFQPVDRSRPLKFVLPPGKPLSPESSVTKKEDYTNSKTNLNTMKVKQLKEKQKEDSSDDDDPLYDESDIDLDCLKACSYEEEDSDDEQVTGVVQKPFEYIPFEPRLDYKWGPPRPPEWEESYQRCIEIEKIELEKQAKLEALKPKRPQKEIDKERRMELEHAIDSSQPFYSPAFAKVAKEELKEMNERQAREAEEEKLAKLNSENQFGECSGTSKDPQKESRST